MSEWTIVPAGVVTTQRKDVVVLEPGCEYRTMGVRWYGKGAYDRGAGNTQTIKAKQLFRAHAGDFVFNRIDTQNGAFDVVSDALDGALATNEFPLYVADPDRLLASFLHLYFQQASVLRQIDAMRAGSEGRSRWKEADFEAWPVPLPSLPEQVRIVDAMSAVDAHISALEVEAAAESHFLTIRRAEFFDLGTPHPVTSVRRAFDVLMGRQRAPQHAQGPHMTDYVRSANVGNGELNLDDIKKMNFTPVERTKFALRPGDVLVSEGSASARAVGMSAVWQGEMEGVVCFQKTLLRFRAVEGVTMPEFVRHWCQWAYESGTFLNISSGTNIKHITAVRVLDVPVALPTLPEQRILAAELDAIAEHRDLVRVELARLRTFRATLLTSILNQKIEIPESYDTVLEAVS